MSHLILIPQHLDSPVTLERLQYKAYTGSSKACDMLDSLLGFTAIAVLGGNPLEDILTADMESQLNQAYEPIKTHPEAIGWAMKWAWPPLVKNWVVFDAAEVLMAVEGLCELLKALPPETLIHNILQFADHQDLESFEYELIGENFKALEIPLVLVKSMLINLQHPFSHHVLKIYLSS